MRLPKLPRRHFRRIPDLLFADEDEEDAARGGYLFTADPDAPLMTLTAAITKRADRFCVSVPPYDLPSGQCYLLGGPGRPTCEVVQVDVGEQVPDEPRRIRRAMFKTLSTVHPAGTLVTPVAVERIEEWEQWESPGCPAQGR